MTPSELKPEQFNGYPPQARQLAVTNIELLRQLPLGFLPLLLRELIAYDWKFPAERKELDYQLAYLNGMTAEQRQREMAAFEALRLSPELEQVDWVNAPTQFSEKLSAHLWATHQIDGFRAASVEYVRKMNAVTPIERLPMARLGVVLIGQAVTENQYPLFRKLRPHGVYFTNVRSENGREILLEALARRANAQPVSFGHWYIDGGADNFDSAGVTCVSYKSLDTVRSAVLDKMRSMTAAGLGPEALRSSLARMRPDDLGLGGNGDAGVLNHFRVSVLAEGSGTQIFSTTFVQWTAREVLRRAQPLTLMARYVPRQQEHSMQEMLEGAPYHPVPDPKGSLVDADMGAYYTWINQQRLTGAQQASFLVWFEGHNEALALAPSLRQGSQENSAISMTDLLNRLS